MNNLNEFLSGLRTILEGPNPPQAELINVIQSTQRDFLTSALAISTLSWPTRTHLELVKIVIGIALPEPPFALILNAPTTTHETDPLFGSEYFEKLRQNLMTTPLPTLASSDGSWVKNIGFSIEATIMQASARATSLEKLEEQVKDNPEFSKIHIYCAHVLGHGTLAEHHWQSIARMIFAVFYVLPFTTRALADDDLSLVSAQMLSHYGSWLQIIAQMIENHGQALCRRMPTVIEDPNTRQFRWGIPTLHAVATVELLRNFVVRRVILQKPTLHKSSPAAEGIAAWASSAEQVAAEEQRLAQMEQRILGLVIARDASAVYGMMTEMHGLLQVAARTSAGSVARWPVASVEASLECTCAGLAPILGFEEHILAAAMDMRKLVECISGMKRESFISCYEPVCGIYPPLSASVPSYAELLLLRTATAVFNVDVAWEEMAASLSPLKMPDTSAQLSARLSRLLRLTAMYFDVFSLNTITTQNAGVATSWTTLASYPFMRTAYAECISHVLHSDTVDVMSDSDSSLVRVLIGLCEFVNHCSSVIDVETLSRGALLFIDMSVYRHLQAASDPWAEIRTLSPTQWTALAKTPIPGAEGAQTVSVLAALWSSPRRLSQTDGLAPQHVDIDRWELAITRGFPDHMILASRIVMRCAESAHAAYSHGQIALDPKYAQSLRVLETELFGPDSDNTALSAFAKSEFPKQFVKALDSIDSLSAWTRTLSLAPVPDTQHVREFADTYIKAIPELFSTLARACGAINETQNPFSTQAILANNTDEREIDASVDTWKRTLARIPFSEAKMHMLALVSSSYPSKARRSLDEVIVRFVGQMPVPGVELVIGSIAEHMWRNQIVYLRDNSPFDAIRRMFAPVNTSNEVDAESAESVEYPGACHRILLYLTLLRYGKVWSDTPLFSWLLDCLARAPDCVLRAYMLTIIGRTPPEFGLGLPIEYDWARASSAFVQAWATDGRFKASRATPVFASAVLCYIFGQGSAWVDEWNRWGTESDSGVLRKPIFEHHLQGLFMQMETSPLQRSVVLAMLSVPLDVSESDGNSALKAKMRSHPMWAFVDMLAPESTAKLLSFASSRDWFMVHTLEPVLATLESNRTSRDLLSCLFSSSEILYAVVPWVDIATSLVQNVPMGNGFPIAMRSQLAKKHFISYLSPLARVLFAMSRFAYDNTLDWQWNDRCLVIYLSESPANDSIDALLDVYTFSSCRALRQSIENALVATSIHSPQFLLSVVARAFSKRPLDVVTLHSIRPRTLCSIMLLPPDSDESHFRPGAEVFPLVKRLLEMAIDNDTMTATAIVEERLWGIAEEPDLRRNLIALKPRLIPKEQRPAPTATGVSHKEVSVTTSGGLHIAAEATASAAAYAIERCVYLLGLLAKYAVDDDKWREFFLPLAHSRVFLAALMTAIGDSMRQFSTVGTTRELFAALWKLADDGRAMVNGVSVAQVWASINFFQLALRISTQMAEEFTPWETVQELPSR